MTKRQKTTRFSIQAYDNAHYRTTEQYARAVDMLFDAATKAISQAASKGKYDPERPFSFDDYPQIKGVMQDVTKQLADRLTTTIETGSKKQWLFACKKNDGFIASIMDTSKLSKARLNKMQDRNLDALKAFQERKVDGMNLSQRVWKYVGQYREQMETALDAGLGEGRSAQQLARDIKQNLIDPNRLFRRVRDKRGNLVLSKAAKAFHPGRGVYRSSVKNAQRLTRSEINMAYRESDWQRWQTLDFVVGIEIVTSNRHEEFLQNWHGKGTEICDRLKGRYPKSFKFVGWHPQCMCYAIPILMDEETFDENELGDLKAALHGTTYKHKQAANTVIDVPDTFKEWVKDHVDAQQGWKSTPYFIRDNFKDGKLSEGLKQTVIPPQPSIDPIQQQLDALKPQIILMRQGCLKWGLSVQLSMLDKYVADKDIAGIQSRMATIQSKIAQMEQADADIRRKCAEWGVNTHLLDSAMSTHDSKQILKAMSDLEDMVKTAENEYKDYISQAGQAIKDANVAKIDTMDVINDLATVLGDKREWVMAKANIKNRLKDLLGKIEQSKGINPTKLDGFIQEIEKMGVEYREVAKLAQIPTDDEIIKRVGGGDKTKGSCASLALAFTANKAGLDVLDFRGGKSLDYFSSRLNLYNICEKIGGYSSLDITGIQLLKQMEIGKSYYVAWARHATIVRQVSKGKYEYMELQSPISNGWKPLDGKIMKWRFGGSGRDVGILMDIELLQKDSGFRKMVGYINTAEVEQKKGETGMIK